MFLTGKKFLPGKKVTESKGFHRVQSFYPVKTFLPSTNPFYFFGKKSVYFDLKVFTASLDWSRRTR